MKKFRFGLFISVLAVLTVLTGCNEEEIATVQCGEFSYKVTKKAQTDEDGSIVGWVIRVYAQDANEKELDNIPEALSLELFRLVETECPPDPVQIPWPCYGRQSIGVHEIPGGAASPYVINENTTIYVAEISAPSCREPIEKTNEDIANDTQEIECDNSGDLTINAEICYDEVVFTWESDVSLSGATYDIYDVSIDLSQGNSTVFPVSDLNAENDEGTLSGADAVCSFTYNLTECPGTDGSISITDPIVADANEAVDITVTVDDADLTESGDFTVMLSSDLGESEEVTLSETESVGIFKGTIDGVIGNTAGTDDDGSLNIEKDVVLTATYDEVIDSEGNDPEPTTVQITVMGDLAPTCDDGIQNGDEVGVDCGGSCDPCAPANPIVTLDGTDYEISAADYIGSSDGSFNYLSFTISEVKENETLGLSIGLTLYDDGAFATGTYSFEAASQGVSDISEVTPDNGVTVYAVTGGSVELTDEGVDGDGFQLYTLQLNLTTEGGNLTGTIPDIVGF